MGWIPGDDAAEIAANAVGRLIRDDFAETSGYGGLAALISFAHGDETLEQTYTAAKLPRLAALKRKWDPENMFRFNFALPTTYS